MRQKDASLHAEVSSAGTWGSEFPSWSPSSSLYKDSNCAHLEGFCGTLVRMQCGNGVECATVSGPEKAYVRVTGGPE